MILGLADGTVREIQDVGEGSAGEVRSARSQARALTRAGGSWRRFTFNPRVTFQIFEAEGARVLDMPDNRMIEDCRHAHGGRARELRVDCTFANEPLAAMMNRAAACGEADIACTSLSPKSSRSSSPCAGRAPFPPPVRKAGFEASCASATASQDVLTAKAGSRGDPAAVGEEPRTDEAMVSSDRRVGDPHAYGDRVGSATAQLSAAAAIISAREAWLRRKSALQQKAAAIGEGTGGHSMTKAANKTEATGAANAAEAPKRIMIVEDERAHRALFCRWNLEHEGFETESEENGRRAYERIVVEQYDSCSDISAAR